MAKYRKKPVVVDAVRWGGRGDHPAVDVFPLADHSACKVCGSSLYAHGWVSTLEGGHIVCPGDWIVTGTKGENYPVKPGIFDSIYEYVEG